VNSISNVPLLSILIAAHNAEPYLSVTLQSVLGKMQPAGPLYEVLVLDDASQDATSEIVRRHMVDAPELRLESVQFCNVGQVRAYAVMQARGTYVLFVDSDDAIMEGGLEWLMNVLSTMMPDLLITPLCEVHGILDCSTPFVSGPIHKRSPASLMGSLVSNKKLGSQLIGKCFRRELLISHPVPPLKCFEDMAVLPHLLAASKSCLYVDTPFYLYRKHSGSLSDWHEKWDRLPDFLFALMQRDAVFGAFIPKSHLDISWIELANVLLHSSVGSKLLSQHPEIKSRIQNIYVWRFLFDPKIRFSRKRMMLEVRKKLAN